MGICSFLLNWLFLRFLACDGLLAYVVRGCHAKPHNPVIWFLIYMDCPTKNPISRPSLATPDYSRGIHGHEVGRWHKCRQRWGSESVVCVNGCC